MNIITIQKRRNFSKYQPILRFQIRSCPNMEEVLSIAFRNLSYSLLRRCMLVSKLWRRLALEELKWRSSVTISQESHIHLVLQRLRNPNFRVGGCQITRVGVSLGNFFLDEMCSKIFRTLHRLNIESHAGVDQSTLFALLIKLPNLDKLSVTFVPLPSRSGSDPQLRFPYFGGDASKDATLNNIPSFRNIHHLQLDFGGSNTFYLSRVFHIFPSLYTLAIANITSEPQKHVKSLHLPVHLKELILRQYSTVGFPEKLVQTLSRFDLQVESLGIISPPSSFLSPTTSLPPQQPSSSKTAQPSSSSLLKQFIESLRNTLKSLKLFQVDDDLQFNCSDSSPTSNYYHWNFNYSTCTSILPLDLPILETLHVQKPHITNLGQTFHFPKVRHLCIQVSSSGINWNCLLPSKLQQNFRVSKLEIDYIDSNSCSLLGYCFPNLETLQLGYLDKNLLAVLCKLIPYFNSNIASRTLVSCQLCHGISHEFTVEQSSRNEEYQRDNEEEKHPDSHQAKNKAEKANIESGNKESLARKATRKDTGVAVLPLDRNSFPRKNINSNFSSTFHHNEKGENGECQKKAEAFPENHVSSPGMIRLETVQEQQGLENSPRKKLPFKNLKLLRVRPCFHLPVEDFVFLQGHGDPASATNQNFSPRNYEDGLTESPIGFSWAMLSSSMKDDKFEEFSTTSTSDGFDETCSSA